MLRKLSENEYKQYLDFAYELALDLSRSCYPTYADGLKTRADFDETAARAFNQENNEMLLFEEGGEALGLIQYFTLPEDSYAQVQIFSVKKNVRQAVEELVAYLRERCAGYMFYFGISETNREAAEALESLGFQLEESNNVGVLRFEDYTPLPESRPPALITRENFPRFAALHAPVQIYWDNAHLLEDLDNWHIYLLEENSQALGGIYFWYVDQSMEIFGIDFPGDVFQPQVFRALMLRAMNQAKADGMADMTFFHGDEERPVAESLGIRRLDLYQGYSIKL